MQSQRGRSRGKTFHIGQSNTATNSQIASLVSRNNHSTVSSLTSPHSVTASASSARQVKFKSRQYSGGKDLALHERREKESEDIAMESKAATTTEIRNILSNSTNHPVRQRSSKVSQENSWNSLSNLKLATQSLNQSKPNENSTLTLSNRISHEFGLRPYIEKQQESDPQLQRSCSRGQKRPNPKIPKIPQVKVKLDSNRSRSNSSFGLKHEKHQQSLRPYKQVVKQPSKSERTSVNPPEHPVNAKQTPRNQSDLERLGLVIKLSEKNQDAPLKQSSKAWTAETLRESSRPENLSMNFYQDQAPLSRNQGKVSNCSGSDLQAINSNQSHKPWHQKFLPTIESLQLTEDNEQNFNNYSSCMSLSQLCHVVPEMTPNLDTLKTQQTEPNELIREYQALLSSMMNKYIKLHGDFKSMQDYYISENARLKGLLDQKVCSNCQQSGKALDDMTDYLNQAENPKKSRVSEGHRPSSKLGSHTTKNSKQVAKEKRISMVSRNKKQATPLSSNTINTSSRNQKVAKQQSSTIRHASKRQQPQPQKGLGLEKDKENSRQMFSSVLVPLLKSPDHSAQVSQSNPCSSRNKGHTKSTKLVQVQK